MRNKKESVESLILVVNVGSTSVKWKLFTEQKFEEREEGSFDRPCDFVHVAKSILRSVGNTERLAGVVHRIVHGAGKCTVERLNAQVIKDIHAFDHLAPLHNPPALECASLFHEYIPLIPQWAVFDSGLFNDLPDVARTYAIPRSLAKTFGIRRYGFHGIAHEYACQEAAKKLKKPLEELTLISIHLGGGDSACLMHQGKPLDVSMGFTPLEGLPMMTRSGDIDPGLIIYLLRKHAGESRSLNMDSGVQSSKFKVQSKGVPMGRLELDSLQATGYEQQESLDWLEHLLNEESGLKGISGESDFLELLGKRKEDADAKLALDVFVYKIKKYIGSYCAASPKKTDAIVFTGTIGSGELFVRNAVMKDLWIAKDVKMITIPPNEELAMARKIQALGVRN